MNKITVKGNSIYFIKRYILDTYGADFFNKMIENLDPETKDILSGALLSDQNYDFKAKDSLLVAFFQHSKSEAAFRDCSTQEVREQLQGLMRVVTKIDSLDALNKNLQFLWNHHFSGGIIKGTRKEQDTFLINISEMKASDAFWIHVEQYLKCHFEEVAKYGFTSKYRRISDTEVEIILSRVV